MSCGSMWWTVPPPTHPVSALWVHRRRQRRPARLLPPPIAAEPLLRLGRALHQSGRLLLQAMLWQALRVGQCTCLQVPQLSCGCGASAGSRRPGTRPHPPRLPKRSLISIRRSLCVAATGLLVALLYCKAEPTTHVPRNKDVLCFLIRNLSLATEAAPRGPPILFLCVCLTTRSVFRAD